MNLFFVDTNTILGFYDSNKPELQKLLKALEELGERLFLSEQTMREIERNKLRVFRQSIENYKKTFSTQKPQLPIHLEDDDSTEISDWNKKRQHIFDKLADSNEEFDKIVSEMLERISKSSDRVSTVFSKFYKNVRRPSESALEKARRRWEVGDPPGKSKDPLGDQLSWETLLENVSDVNVLWLVTADKDYYTRYNGECILNPALRQNLLDANGNVDVRIFSKLSDAIRDFDKADKLQDIPSAAELDKIATAETIIADVHDEPRIAFYTVTEAPRLCPKCGAKDSFTSGSYLRSQLGGLTLQYVCLKCGFHLDTGDFFD